MKHLHLSGGSKSWHKNDMCLEEIGLYAQNVLTILGLIVNKIEGIYLAMRNFTLIVNKTFMSTIRITRHMTSDMIWIC
jgi:hypothetical protein